ncbi:nitronate monooxygenase family protein [Sphingopyxis sp. JAI128]|uniref:NAD(P)H-dependent flavin oxidoreductase n=1 Tax=Sphingopyxis sp. JAI128 TaxID=2723066 RepID=UPI00161EC630|nr:nitronate monooxygenase [Sphingopyxis sp. JAI128]MBB6426854.1 nitronate monooxygenase [Sphingopyxis sp. JAI128]
MALPDRIRDRMVLPAVCAPMFLVSGPDLVGAACRAGIVGALPRANARDIESFESWLKQIRNGLDRYADEVPGARIGPLAVNLATRMREDELRANLDLCGKYGVEIIISATGDPTELASQVHDWGGLLWHDVVSLRFAEKAIAAGVDGMTCVGAGGGGHSGNIGHLVLVPKIREMFDGTLLMAGSISTGAAIRAAEVLGADLAYMGTRFIATEESRVDPAYHQMLVESGSNDLMFTGKIAGVPANWLVRSMERVGLDPKKLPVPEGKGMRHDHLPEGVRPWRNLWSAGQGIDLIHDIPTVADLVERLRDEYRIACELPAFGV